MNSYRNPDARTYAVSMRDYVRTVSPPAIGVAETVRTFPTANKRFELRVHEEDLAAWQQLAKVHNVSVSDFIRAAVGFAATQMPRGWIQQQYEEAENAKWGAL